MRRKEGEKGEGDEIGREKEEGGKRDTVQSRQKKVIG